MFWQKFLISVKIIIILIALGILFYVFNQVLMPFGGHFDASYDFSQDAENFSHLGPWQRLHPPSEDENGNFQQLKDDLVYFDFYLPQYFRDLDVQIIYQAIGQDEIYFGPEVSLDNYQRELLEPKVIEENVYQACEHFDLNSAYVPNNQVRFMISVPGLNKNNTILKIYQMDFRLSRPTINPDQLSPGVASFLKRIFNYFK